MMSQRFFSLFLFVTLTACSGGQKSTAPDVTAVSSDDEPAEAGPKPAKESPTTPPATMVETAGTLTPLVPEAIAARVQQGRERLQSTEPGRRVWNAIEAQGGLEPWFSSGALYFRFNYAPLGDRGPNDTYQTVDTWYSLARQQLASDESVEFGWDGKRAWANPPDAELPTNPRFWALTPYYFVGIPFVLADPGVELETMPDASFEGTTYKLVKATFEPGTGDAPGDYYVLYIHPETSRVEAIRYVVSYPGFYPDGGHGDEKLMSYDGSQTVGDLSFPESYRTFEFDVDSGEVGDVVTKVTLSDVEWRDSVPTSYFTPSEGARIIEGWK